MSDVVLSAGIRSNLLSIQNTAKLLDHEVEVDPNLIEKARIPLQRMMDITNDQSVSWPSQFEV